MVPAAMGLSGAPGAGCEKKAAVCASTSFVTVKI
jgi:hypothetical protein